MAKKQKPVFDKRIFWDVDFDRLDYDEKDTFVIERVFERGDVEDIRNCRRYYGDEKVTEVLLNAKFLPEHRIHLASAVTGKSFKRIQMLHLETVEPGTCSLLGCG
jgi:hypothetical protein